MERKKIVPKAKLNAAQQEELLQQLQQDTESTVTIQQNQDNTVNLQQNTESKPEIQKEVIKNTAKTVKPKHVKATSVKVQQNTAQENKTTNIQRITVDMPTVLYDRMKEEVDENGQTIKGFIVNLVKAHFAKK